MLFEILSNFTHALESVEIDILNGHLKVYHVNRKDFAQSHFMLVLGFVDPSLAMIFQQNIEIVRNTYSQQENFTNHLVGYT